MDDVNQQVVDEMRQILEQKLFDWSRGVKIAAGWVCQHCGFGLASDREFLESHHIKPKELFPELIYELENGECDCLWRHILQHDNPIIPNMILLRLVILLTTRLFGNHKTFCQKELEERYSKR